MGAMVDEGELEIPPQLTYLYDLFMGLRFSRIPNNDESVDAEFSLIAKDSLSYSDIHYNSLLTGLELNNWEIDCINSMNAIFDKYSS